MLRIRLVHYYPELAARIPVREICTVAAGAGRAILAAGAYRGPARQKAFSELLQRWGRVPPDVIPKPIASRPAMLRYSGYHGPHEDHDIHREGQAVLVAAVPDTDPAAPWCLTAEEVTEPVRFHITSTAFDGVQHIHRNAFGLTIGDGLVVQPQ